MLQLGLDLNAVGSQTGCLSRDTSRDPGSRNECRELGRTVQQRSTPSFLIDRMDKVLLFSNNLSGFWILLQKNEFSETSFLKSLPPSAMLGVFYSVVNLVALSGLERPLSHLGLMRISQPTFLQSGRLGHWIAYEWILPNYLKSAKFNV